jgi:hypothetical protein
MPPLKARPPLDVSAVAPARTGGLPWPLVEPPSLAPHWDPARSSDACADGSADRHAWDKDQRKYVALWCRIRSADRGALDGLATVARNARPDLAKAARLDVVNLVADGMDAIRALAWFDSVGLTSTENVDLLAGTYVATGKLSDAEVVAEALIADSHAKEFVACERLLDT